MRIGYISPHYPVYRNILGKCPGVTYVRSRSFASAILKVAGKVGIDLRNELMLAYCGGTADWNVDLYHFFNTIGMPPCRKPYITTFESSVPRTLHREGRWYQMELDSVRSDKCRKLIALSDSARRCQMQVTPDISDKVIVLHPPQPIIDDAIKCPSRGKPLRFIFVGNAFWHKGGGEAVRALNRLRHEYPIELVCVGDVERHDYMHAEGIDDTGEIKRIIAGGSNWIEWHKSLPNGRVAELMRTCHIGLLPTRADSYGFSVLEMQAAALPCITTDIRALSEINNDNCGWLIRVPKNEIGEAYNMTSEQRLSLSSMIENGLEHCVRSVFENFDEIASKSRCAVKRIKSIHDPAMFGRRLLAVYRDALA